jgi:hypothetical protein
MSEETKLVGGNARNEKTVKLSQQSRLGKLFARYSKTAAGVTGGAAGAAGVFGLMSLGKPDPVDETGKPVGLTKPEVPTAPIEASLVTEDMSFNEAFATARNEVGATGYFTWHGKVFNPIYDGELNQLSAEEQKALFSNTMKEWGENHVVPAVEQSTPPAPVVVIHDEAPESDAVTDDMSFKDAFAVARADVGPGGTFTWHGKEYSTYTSEEWNSMSEGEQQEFIASSAHEEVAPTAISQQEVDIEAIDNTDSEADDVSGDTAAVTGVATTTASTGFETGLLISDEYVPDGQGGTLHVALFEVNGQTIMRVDTDGDGSYDTQMTPDGDGNLVMSNEAGEEVVVSQEEIAQLQDAQETDATDVEMVYPQDVIPVSDFNPDASGMEEWSTDY